MPIFTRWQILIPRVLPPCISPSCQGIQERKLTCTKNNAKPGQKETLDVAISCKLARSERWEKKLPLLSNVQKDKTKCKADGTAKTCNVFTLYISKRPKNSPSAGIARAIR